MNRIFSKTKRILKSSHRKKIKDQILLNEKFFLILVIIISFTLRIKNIFSIDFIGPHQGRQIQTIWPVYYWINHEFTPLKSNFIINGDLKTWNMEFPIYQWLVFIFHKFLGINIVILSKLLSFLSFSVAVILVYLIFSKLNISIFSKYLSVLIYAFSPFTIYWSSVGMVDNLATSFALYYLYTKVTENKKVLNIVFLTMSALIKPNIAFLYWSCGFAYDLAKSEKQVKIREEVKNFSLVIVLTCVWLLYARFSSNMGTVVSGLTSFFGTPQQYLETPYNFVAIFSRFFSSMLGIIPTFAILVGAVFSQYSKLITYFVVLVVLEVLLFVNVNFQDYYQICIVPIFVIVIGLCIEGLIHINTLIKSKFQFYIASVMLVSVLFSFKEGISPWYINSTLHREIDINNKYFQPPIVTTYQEFEGYNWGQAPEDKLKN